MATDALSAIRLTAMIGILQMWRNLLMWSGSASEGRLPAAGCRPELVTVGPGLKARLHWRASLAVLRGVRHVLRNHGFRKAARCLARLFGREGYAIFQIFGGRQIKVFLSDVYWMSPLLKVGDYEPDVKHFLATLMTEDSAFLDCGANIGWWSLFASTKIPFPERILAIEASPAVFELLQENAALNSNAFTPLNAAVWGSTGKHLTLLSVADRHAGASVESEMSQTRDRSERVAQSIVSVAIDDLVRRHLAGFQGPFIVKLDVEGAEWEALRGAQRLLEKNPLIIYEDHGKDFGSTATRTLMEAGFRIFYCDTARRVRSLPDLRSVQAVKQDPKIGYNFAACRPDSHFFAKLADDRSAVHKTAGRGAMGFEQKDPTLTRCFPLVRRAPINESVGERSWK